MEADSVLAKVEYVIQAATRKRLTSISSSDRRRKRANEEIGSLRAQSDIISYH